MKKVFIDKAHITDILSQLEDYAGFADYEAIECRRAIKIVQSSFDQMCIDIKNDYYKPLILDNCSIVLT